MGWGTAFALGLVVGCGSPESGRSMGFGPGITGVPGSDDDDMVATDEGPADDPAPDDDDSEKLDLPEPEAPADSCFAVDLLFVIDNSGSMCDEQEGLAEVVPALVDSMFDTLPVGTDIHVGIVTTSFSHGGAHNEVGCLAREGPAVIEEAYVTDTVVNENGYQGRLFEYDGRNYFAARTHDDAARDELADWFSGAIVSVGCSGGAFDFTSAATAYAVDPANADSNDGFLRDAGAALAIFVLTNETDHSPEGLATYRQTILDAKAECGGEDCIITAGLLAPNCVPDYDPMVWQFLNAFGRTPTWGDIDNFAGYSGVVAETLAEGLVEACEEIEPVG